jgi:hypothetical protein
LQQSTSGLQKMTAFLTVPQKIVVSHTKESFKNTLVMMCVNHSISLRFFSSDEFKALNGEMATKLQEKILEF